MRCQLGSEGHKVRWPEGSKGPEVSVNRGPRYIIIHTQEDHIRTLEILLSMGDCGNTKITQFALKDQMNVFGFK